jgi:prepilin-type N-terminal cleavage/methylation domain-containing protein
MALKKISRFRPGFSLMELIIAVAIIAVLAMMAVPALMSIVPRYELRASARSAQALLQQARLKAAHANRPARVAIDCQNHTAGEAKSPPCQATLYTANFGTSGALRPSPDTWSKVAGAACDLPRSVDVAAATGSTAVSGNPARLFWAVYLPDGRLLTSHQPWVLVFTSNKAKTPSWELEPNLETGGIDLRKGS